MTPYAEQFATMFLAVAGDYPMGEDEVIAYMAPMLRGTFSSSQYPSIESVAIQTVEDEYGTFQVQGGPWVGRDITGEDAQYITGVKWNLRSKAQDKVTSELIGKVRTAWRATRNDIKGQGYEVLNWSLKQYGQALTGDHGVPTTPPLPPRKSPVIEPTKPPDWVDGPTKKFPWGWLIAGAVGVVAVANMGDT